MNIIPPFLKAKFSTSSVDFPPVFDYLNTLVLGRLDLIPIVGRQNDLR